MKATISLEFIGANTYQQLQGISNFVDQISPGLAKKFIGDVPKGIKPWVAEITGKDDKFGLKRSFLKPNFDYKNANSKGSRGVQLWFVLESDRLYQVYERTSWKGSRKYFCAVNVDGSIYELNDKEVEEWLNAL